MLLNFKMEHLSSIIVKWNGIFYAIEVQGDDTYGDLKYAIYQTTGLAPPLQKFVNLNLGALREDPNATLDQMHVTNGFILTMTAIWDEPMPSTSRASRGSAPQVPIIVRTPETAVKTLEVKVRNPEIIIQPRHGKKLMVLDIDQTIYDGKRVSTSGSRAVRPYLHQFLTKAYDDYDIIIWSATQMNVIMKKVNALGIVNNHNYKIVDYMDITQMTSVLVPGVCERRVKALQVIWRKYKSNYNHKNTILCDDQETNFCLNKSNGVLVEPYYNIYNESDTELVLLSKYLKYILAFTDLTKIDHTNWKRYVKLSNEKHF